MHRILVLDDDVAQLDFIKKLFDGLYECELYSNPLKALESFSSEDYSCLITDLHMPVNNGVSFIKKVREMKGSNLPVFVFSNDFTTASKVSCLELNIADYLNPGMDSSEIIFRVKNGLARYRKLMFEKILIDEELLQVYVNDTFLDVTQIEYKILIFLLRNQGRVSKRKLLSFIWPSSFVLDKTLNTHMTNLRNKLKAFQYTLQTSKDDVVQIVPL